jgi:Plasmid encoded RepA protein
MADLHELIIRHGREAAREMVPPKQRSLVDIAAEILAAESNDFSTTYAGFCLTSLPHRDPGVRTWERKNGRCSLLVEAGRINEGGRWLECGLPFGSKARLILLYMQTMAVRDQSRFIELGTSLHDWMKRLGVPVGGKSYSQVREQARRLSACTMYLGFATATGAEATTKTPIANTILLAPSRPKASAASEVQGSLWEERVELSQPFYELLQKHPVPVYEPAIQRLQNNSAALDVYVWLCYRLHVVQEATPISWAALKQQFGQQYATVRQFRHRFKETLALALAVYPGADVHETSVGLTLNPSPPAVAKRHLRIV